MNYSINEKRLNELIENYLDKMYDTNNIGYTEYFDDDGNPSDEAYKFYMNDYDDDSVIFRLYNESYFNYPQELAPLLSFENDDEYSKLIDLFDDKWQPVFIKWFEKNFKFKVKTVDGYYNR